MSKNFILALLVFGLAVKRPGLRKNMHGVGDNLENVPPLLSHLHVIPQDELFLVLRFFCFEALDDPIEALHYYFELDRFIARIF